MCCFIIAVDAIISSQVKFLFVFVQSTLICKLLSTINAIKLFFKMFILHMFL